MFRYRIPLPLSVLSFQTKFSYYYSLFARTHLLTLPAFSRDCLRTRSPISFPHPLSDFHYSPSPFLSSNYQPICPSTKRSLPGYLYPSHLSRIQSGQQKPKNGAHIQLRQDHISKLRNTLNIILDS